MKDRMHRDVLESIMDAISELWEKYFIPNNGSECSEKELLTLVNEKLPEKKRLSSLEEIISVLDSGKSYLKERTAHFDVRHQEDGKVLLIRFDQQRYSYKGLSRLIYDILVRIPVVGRHYRYEDRDIDLLVIPV